MSKLFKHKYVLVILLAVILAALLTAILVLELTPREPADVPTEPQQTQPPTQAPTNPPWTKEATATIGSVGDLLMQMPIIEGSYNTITGNYDFGSIFSALKPYVSRLDYAAANLKTTLCGSNNGYDYAGAPYYNCPDFLVTAAKNAGFDMLLTANELCFSTGSTGLHRTQQVISNFGLDHNGTRAKESDNRTLVKDINGIRIGMVNYTAVTSIQEDGRLLINGLPLPLADSALINAFDYNRLEDFYAQLSEDLESMYAAGADAVIVFMHWGEALQNTPNALQRAIAQKLCDLGVDVIIGSHPGVVQPLELLTSTVDETQKTLCMYSTGNTLSNQRREFTNAKLGHSEDGVLFSVTFARYADGTVVLESTQLIPTWTNRYRQEDVYKYTILPLEHDAQKWQSLPDMTDELSALCQESYNRTMGIIGTAVDSANEYYAQHQQEVEAAIGATK